ncbi:MAG: PAS domain-containing protein [Fibromonadaceae bacterium]|jgi:PAS domain S-box-containing protein|nr:PAS domain-containing protein [Fibromonadaceae bacterium]
MTIDENINEAEDAVCIANCSGRILTANKRFCKMFGFELDEVKWHYLCDLYRRKSELDRILKKLPEKEEVFKTRMRNRAGRSFPCLLRHRATKSNEGIPLMMHSIQRVAA